eukprot:TRINITY_DN63859_c0_g1_i1.p2 TRINITY_DN63859_c0_g1~~TRINITY_DN63859_c0_g1_i1.p2  ORF type:complete len:147 (-),score=14.42 TRINITY_DN63859_c0_g1_i1:100-540(-)
MEEGDGRRDLGQGRTGPARMVLGGLSFAGLLLGQLPSLMSTKMRLLFEISLRCACQIMLRRLNGFICALYMRKAVSTDGFARLADEIQNRLFAHFNAVALAAELNAADRFVSVVFSGLVLLNLNASTTVLTQLLYRCTLFANDQSH